MAKTITKHLRDLPSGANEERPSPFPLYPLPSNLPARLFLRPSPTRPTGADTKLTVDEPGRFDVMAAADRDIAISLVHSSHKTSLCPGHLCSPESWVVFAGRLWSWWKEITSRVTGQKSPRSMSGGQDKALQRSHFFASVSRAATHYCTGLRWCSLDSGGRGRRR